MKNKMKIMGSIKKVVLSVLLSAGCVAGASASTEGIAWDKAPNHINDMVSLQNGAKLFVNYCLNCHAAAYMRYNRLTDIGLTEKQIKDNLLFATDKVGETMKVAMDPKQAKDWFGANPPDLTVIARSRAGGQGSGAAGGSVGTHFGRFDGGCDPGSSSPNYREPSRDWRRGGYDANHRIANEKHAGPRFGKKLVR